MLYGYDAYLMNRPDNEERYSAHEELNIDTAVEKSQIERIENKGEKL